MDIEIIVGSTLGSAEYVADELEALLKDDHQVKIHLNAEFSELNPSAFWLICSSTHGAGDVPDNLQPFFQHLLEQQPDLSTVSYSVVAIGSSSYDTFCGAGKNLDQQMKKLGAKSLKPRLEIDVDLEPVPEEPAALWLKSWKNELI
ncbi:MULTISPECIES: FMN-binding protein MioC [unclassified Agarivorans]|uniref:FMN-binding protein MioC n=1 Tax=unclassified Agarivorans TaxID=2636026 RepID=UPI0026E2929C|nr:MULTISPECIES: FMN-binding protein MioC [unclassified Agarivorans]MDO6685834.1 FMN-binding protein MioC [Agarivorans sp. 3_MG-2023]MDO6716051.1 FMN-binding protein MioC [Agarivorans sp. 2_MG-2023]